MKRRMLRHLLLGSLALLLVGCAEYGYRMNELVGLQCRPDVAPPGQCVRTQRVSP